MPPPAKRDFRFGVISDAVSACQASPRCPWFQTYCCPAVNDIQGHFQTRALQQML